MSLLLQATLGYMYYLSLLLPRLSLSPDMRALIVSIRTDLFTYTLFLEYDCPVY